MLVNIAEYNDWAKPQFFIIQNVLCNAITTRYHIIKRHSKTISPSNNLKRFALPVELSKRLSSLVAREVAQLIWNTKAKIQIPKNLHQCISNILDYLETPSLPWSKPIGHIIPHDPHICTASNAASTGSGVVCWTFKIWAYIPISQEITTRLHLTPSNPNYIHMNCLEYWGVML